jgi:hypothetical protein
MDELKREALLIWGRDFQRELDKHLKAAAGEKHPLFVNLQVLLQYLVMANDIIIERIDTGANAGKRPAHRPKGTGAGARVEALVATGLSEDDAKRAVANELGMAPVQLEKALRWHRRLRKAPKKSEVLIDSGVEKLRVRGQEASKKSRVLRQQRRKTRSS